MACIFDWISVMGWLPLFQIMGLIQEEVVHIFYSNMFEEDFSTQSFCSSVYKVPLTADVIAELLSMPQVTKQELEFLIDKLTMAQKLEWVQELYGKFIKRDTELKHSACRSMGKFLHWMFTYNLLPTTHYSGLTDDTTYLIHGIFGLKRIDLALVIYHVMLKATTMKHSIGSIYSSISSSHRPKSPSRLNWRVDGVQQLD